MATKKEEWELLFEHPTKQWVRKVDNLPFWNKIFVFAVIGFTAIATVVIALALIKYLILFKVLFVIVVGLGFCIGLGWWLFIGFKILFGVGDNSYYC
jgi:hypothetical protein